MYNSIKATKMTRPENKMDVHLKELLKYAKSKSMTGTATWQLATTTILLAMRCDAKAVSVEYSYVCHKSIRQISGNTLMSIVIVVPHYPQELEVARGSHRKRSAPIYSSDS